MGSQSNSPEISVIICAHNPRADILRAVLKSLAAQTLDPSRWELIIVDNNSRPPLNAVDLCDGLNLPLRVIREPEPGLTPARRRGVDEAAADLLVLVDDDNVLGAEYLSTALQIAQSQPRLGAFGGATEPVLQSRNISAWKKKLLPYLGVRDYGPDEITSNKDEWGHWEPIGAGMVLRRDVACKFIQFVQSVPLAVTLDRSGKGLLSGGDSLIARAAYRLGYFCSYQPRLRLAHIIKKQRLQTEYLWRLLYGHGRSYVILNSVLGKPSKPISSAEVLGRLSYRFVRDGFSGLICWAWDIGYFVESRAASRAAVTQPKRGPDVPAAISIVIPNFNSGPLLQRAIQSLLDQQYPNLQIILMDAGSTDESRQIIERFRNSLHTVVIEKDKGQADALNKGFSRATGEIVGWLCADDQLLDGALEHVADLFEKIPALDILTGSCERVFADGARLVCAPDVDPWSRIGTQNVIEQSATFWRADLHRRAGPISLEYHICFDWDLWNRFRKAGARISTTNELLSRYYFSDSNKTATAGRRFVHEAFHILRQYGPLGGALAYVYRFLFNHFDLKGCYDKPPTCTLMRSHAFVWTLAALTILVGKNRLYLYNWHFAACQERGIKWW